MYKHVFLNNSVTEILMGERGVMFFLHGVRTDRREIANIKQN